MADTVSDIQRHKIIPTQSSMDNVFMSDIEDAIELAVNDMLSNEDKSHNTHVQAQDNQDIGGYDELARVPPHEEDAADTNTNTKVRKHQRVENAKTIKDEQTDTDQEGVSEEALLEQISRDESCMKRCKIFRFLSIAVVIGAFLTWELLRYLDSDSNTYSSSSLTKITSIDAPYVMFKAVSHKVTPWLEYVYLQSANEVIYYTDMTRIALFYNESDNINNIHFDYNPDTSNWTLIEIAQTVDDTLLNASEFEIVLTSIIIPPKDSIITLEETMFIGLIAATNQVNAANDIDDKSEFIHSFADGLSYGIWWLTDSRNQFILKGLQHPVDFFMSRFGNNSQYVFSGQISLVYIDAYETIDQTKTQHHEEFYLSRVGAMYYDYDYTATDAYCTTWMYVYVESETKNANTSSNTTNNDYQLKSECARPSFWTVFYFMPNPSGIKTTIQISKLRDIFDVLSSVGGIFSPLLTMTGFLFLYCVYGLDAGCIRFKGIAPFSGFNDDIFEKKLNVYLAERGLVIIKKTEAEKEDVVANSYNIYE